MENVLDKELKGFIGPDGIFVRVTNIMFDESDTTEIIAESICRSVLRCEDSIDKIEERLGLKNRSLSYLQLFKTYLIEYFGYLYVHIKYLDDCVEICELSSKSANEIQQEKVMNLCKQDVSIQLSVKEKLKKKEK